MIYIYQVPYSKAAPTGLYQYGCTICNGFLVQKRGTNPMYLLNSKKPTSNNKYNYWECCKCKQIYYGGGEENHDIMFDTNRIQLFSASDYPYDEVPECAEFMLRYMYLIGMTMRLTGTTALTLRR